MARERVALITGAGRGIGAAIARRFATDGMAVGVADVDPAASARTAEEINASGGHGFAITMDVTDAAQVAEGVAIIASELGAPTVLVNNAGIIRDNLLFRMTDSDWDQVIGVHLRGAFLVTRQVQRFMVEQEWGRIVNLSSTSALGNRGQVNYAAAKAGLQGFTKALALELGRFRVTANAIAPGFIESDMTAATAERLGVTFEEFRESSARQIAVGRTGLPDDIAHAASFLVSEGAGFISGQTLYVAGGPTG